MIDLTAPIESYGSTPDITHMDLYYKGVTASLACLITDCVLLDLTGGAEDVAVARVPELELVEEGNSVLLKTGWEKHRGTPAYDNCPWVDKGLVACLVDRGVSLVLVDSPGIYGGKRGPEHNEMDKYLADHEAYAVENLVNVDRIRAKKFRLYCFPIHISAQNSAPCRIVAVASG
jgi:kynurenine formamidase